MSGNVCKWCGSRQQGDYGHVFARDMDRVQDILEGSSPTNSESEQ